MTQTTALLVDRIYTSKFKAPRLNTLDLLRGIVLLLMALDHTRHFFSSVADPLNFAVTTPALFFTRWITHYCAPVFIFLAGMSAYLFEVNTGASKRDLSLYLLTRGLWFIFIECTLNFAIWTFYLVPYHFSLQIFWAIGLSMMALSLLIYLPRRAIFAFALLLIAGHNLFDAVTVADMGQWGWLWHFLHVPGVFTLLNYRIDLYYPIIPWIGVMALGYVIGPILLWPEQLRCQFFIRIGIAICILFFALRFLNMYGDLHAWTTQKNIVFTSMAFFNCEKYPPSLDYLLMTLGPAFIFLGVATNAWCENKLGYILVQFGRVPFFFYMLHMPFILSLALLPPFLQGGLASMHNYYDHENVFHYALPVVYVVWFAVIAALYVPCVWYGKYKANHRYRILSYL